MMISEDAKIAAYVAAKKVVKDFNGDFDAAIDHHAKQSRLHLEIVAALYRLMPDDFWIAKKSPTVSSVRVEK